METNFNPPNQPKPEFAKRVFRWLLLVAGTLAIFGIAYELVMQLAIQATHKSQSRTEWFVYLVAVIVALAAALLILPLAVRRVKWVNRLRLFLFTWCMARRALIGLAVLATITVIIYTGENWRGRRAWEKCKRDLEAKGEVLDWSAYIPAPVPDEQNIMKAPKMADWFLKNWPRAGFLTNELSAKLNATVLRESANRNDPKSAILVANLIVVPGNFSTTNGAEVVVRLDSPGTRRRIGKIIEDTVGPSAIGSQSFTFVLNPLSQIRPGRILLQTDKPLSVADLSEVLPASLVSSNVGHLRVEAGTDGVSFRVVLVSKPAIAAADYLAWSDNVQPEFNMIREALKRPYIRMDGDFQRPFVMQIANFVNIRNVAQTTAQRAQCCLLLGRSEQAFHELSLIFELRRLLAAKPVVLVSAMIDVAITGLYADVIADGLRLQAWRESELIALQEQLQRINLPSSVADSFRGERAAVCHTIEITTAREMGRLFSYDPEASLWKKITDPMFLFFTICPRGWLYQNMALIAPVEQIGIEIFSPTNRVIEPGRASSAVAEINRLAAHRSPYAVLAAIAVPNYSKATQTTARNQTKVNEAFVACGLERYHLGHGEYPETLDALVPQFVEKLPHDIIGGQPLKYHRTDDGQFLLYSVGWNETDDGGVEPPKNKSGNPDWEKGDWVWGQPAR